MPTMFSWKKLSPKNLVKSVFSWSKRLIGQRRTRARGHRPAKTSSHSEVETLAALQKQLLLAQLQLAESQSVARIGSWSVDVPSGAISWTAQMFEFFPVQSPPKTTDEMLHFIHSEDQQYFKKTIDEYLSSGHPLKIRYRVINAKKVIWIEAISQAKKRVDGGIRRIFGTCQDITERVLLEQENSFITSALKIGVWKWDIETNSLAWDASMYEVFGVDRADFTGAYEAWESTLLESNREATVKELQKAVAGEKEFDTTFQIKTKAGEIRSIGGYAVVLRDGHGKAMQVNGINWDKTKEVEMKLAFERERVKSVHNARLASLGEMSAGVAHEINNPLSIISGSLQLLPKEFHDPILVEKRLQNMTRAVDRMAKIVKGLRKFSRGSAEESKTIQRVSQIISSVAEVMEMKASLFAVQIICNLKSDPEFFCNEAAIEQVLINLMSNSIDAVKNLSERWLKIELYEEDIQIVIRVTDSGPGLPEAIRERLFDPFFTTKPVGEGTGLGLSIAQGIVVEHGGTITCLKDHPHTCFELRF